jgi:hypothetical protein
LNEEEVYHAARAILTACGWQIVGGQAPGGSHNIPLLEIKDPCRVGKGSSGCFKPDLVCYRLHNWLLVEAKPRYSESDRKKLLTILADTRRLAELAKELAQRNLLLGREPPTGLNVHGALAYSGERRLIDPLGCIMVNDNRIYLPSLA